jgi:threonine/homoserine/homoserine lactone efflux protein
MEHTPQALIAVAGLVGVAAATPGPNNLIVMRAAAQSGVARALPIVASIVLGSLALLGFAASGIAALLAAHPQWRMAMSLAGALYLVWLGTALALNGSGNASRHGSPTDEKNSWPSSPAGLFAFQFLNPKGWAMMLSAASTGVALSYLVAILAAITTVCLVGWSLFGWLLQTRLEDRTFRVWFDRTMGCLLITSAALLVL